MASILHFPAPILLGASCAVMLAVCLRPGFRPYIDPFSYQLALAIMGAAMGAGINGTFWHQLQNWLPSLISVLILVLMMMSGSILILKKFFKMNLMTAFLATSPGALPFAIALADQKDTNMMDVIILQALRLLLITISFPVIVDLAGLQGNFSQGHVNQILSYLQAASVVLASLGLGWFLEKLRMPAGYMVAGMIVSASLHSYDVVQGQMPWAMTAFAFLILGGLIAQRFEAVSWSHLKRLLLAMAAVNLFTFSLSVSVALILSTWLDLPFGQLWVSYMPGGVETMAALALILDYDPAFVATHHITRLFFLFMILPIYAGWMRHLTISSQ